MQIRLSLQDFFLWKLIFDYFSKHFLSSNTFLWSSWHHEVAQILVFYDISLPKPFFFVDCFQNSNLLLWWTIDSDTTNRSKCSILTKLIIFVSKLLKNPSFALMIKYLQHILWCRWWCSWMREVSAVVPCKMPNGSQGCTWIFPHMAWGHHIPVPSMQAGNDQWQH